MNQVISLFFLFALGSGKLFCQNPLDTLSLSAVEWEKNTFDFGRIPQDTGIIKFTYRFRNNGQYPLVIENVKQSFYFPLEYSKEPVPPGSWGFIQLEFNTSGKIGKFSKSTAVIMNTSPPVQMLYYSGEIY